MLGFLVLVVLKKVVGWDLCANIWAVYLLIRLQNVFVEGSTDTYLLYAFRFIPQDLVVLLVIAAISGSSLAVSRRQVSSTKTNRG